MNPQLINTIPKFGEELDDFLILSASWEERCLGFAQKAKNYHCKNILINVYDNKTTKKEKLLKELTLLLQNKGNLKNFTSKQSNPIIGIKHMLHYIKENCYNLRPKISIDISCFTRKHLLLLLNCLDTNNLLLDTKFYYSQPFDYFSEINDSNAEGIKTISEIETFSGENLASQDTALLLFLNFEGKRAISLWNQIQPHITIPIIPFPEIKKGWEQRIFENNKLLLSTLNIDKESIEKVSPIDPNGTKELLTMLTAKTKNRNALLKNCNYNYIIAPLGTKPQIVGIYKYYRLNPNNVSIIYPSPIQYKDMPTSYSMENLWYIDNSSEWEIITNSL